jgi:hypothetical protein
MVGQFGGGIVNVELLKLVRWTGFATRAAAMRRER